MNRIIQFALFFSVFFLFTILLHFYIFSRLADMFGLKKQLLFYIIVIASALSFPIASVVERFLHNLISRSFYAVFAVGFGIIFFLFWAVLLHDLTSLFVSFNSRVAGSIILAVVFVLTALSVINALFLPVKVVEVENSKLDKQLNIVQLSDIHVGTIHNAKYLQKIVRKTNSLNPDVVLITGDLVDGSSQLNEKAFLPLKELQATAFFTTGNHERYEGVDNVVQFLNQTPVRALRNELVDFRGIQIIGIDDPDDFDRSHDAISKIRINKSKPSVLMYHQPKGIKKTNKAGVDLQLSGHTHNGQIIPFNFIVKFFFPYVKGLYEYNGTYVYVSPGTGTWGPPMRLGSRNEITLIKLVPSNNQNK